ncbi:glycoside hydrolase family 26 protein [Streptomyces sp. NBC_00829]|uniref:glycoside hydrolase family 26 protein n=1 Tax=Streptomyces sp. NBC_00829 TaxID=2903679 RepID=UPI00386B130B|nr:glycosyl hydrolase [Streptomyces sp. NBC_00829]
MRITTPRVLALVCAGLLSWYTFQVAPDLADRERRAAVARADAVLPPTTVLPDDEHTPARPESSEPKVPFPAPGKAFIGVFTSEGTHDFTEAADFARQTRHRPQVFEFSADWASDVFDAEAINKVARRGMLPMVAWEPWDHRAEAKEPTLRGEQSRYRLSRIIDGSFDSHLRSWARGIASLRYPVAIRLAHEMNGYWYPWCEQSNGNRRGEYVRAWRHVHKVFEAEGARNAVWVWSPNVSYTNSTALNRLYPGDAYVDWVGLSGYYGTVGKENYQSFDRLFSPTRTELRRFTRKPLVITELGATDAAGRKAEWITGMFRALPRHPDIIGVIWYQAVKEIDWRVGTDRASSSAFAAGASASRYQQPWGPAMTPRLR